MIKSFFASFVLLCTVSLSVSAQIKLDANNNIGLRLLNPTTEIESYGLWRFGLSNGAILYDHNGQFGMPNLHPEECWGAGLGNPEQRYFDLWVHDIFTD